MAGSMDGAALGGLELVDIDRDLYRNIVSLRHSQNLFDDLSDDPSDWEAAIRLETGHKPRHYESSDPVIHRPFEEAEFNAAIQYPFDHWSHSRFSQGHFGVWYGSETLETTVHESVHHWRQGLLADAGWQDLEGVAVERRVHLVYCHAALIDLLPKAKAWPALTSNDPANCQALGERLHHEGHPGLWTPSARCSGTNAAVFTPRVLSKPRTHCYLTYRLEGGRVLVQREPGATMMTL